MKRFYSIVAVILSLAFFVLTPVQSFATTSEELQEQQKKLEEEEKALKQQKKAAENEKAEQAGSDSFQRKSSFPFNMVLQQF